MRRRRLYPTTFTFAALVTYDQTYGVTVLKQPTGQTCTVKNGAGEMKDDPVVQRSRSPASTILPEAD